jgi:DNA polymerase III sliding clamp (beta) subunit (PCNA family)
MKITLKTEKLKEMVTRSAKGVGNNKLIPITSLMAIELKDNVLTLITTDATNYLYIVENKVTGDNFYVVVDANIFYKLISKMTCENVTLEIKEGLNALEVKGNGTYKIDLPTDENGEYIKYPDPYDKLKLVSTDCGTVNKTTIQVILETIKPALAVTLENPCYTGYYMGDSVVATDTYKIADMHVKMFDEPKLISAELLDLLSVMTAEKINVEQNNNDIIYITPDCIVCGKLMEGIEDFAIEPIMGLVNTEFDSVCSVPKNKLLQLLDRVSLFVGTYDKNAVHLTFTERGLQVSSKATSGVEIVEYVSSTDFKSFTCAIDIQMFMQEVKAISNDVIEIHYGEDTSIKMIDGNITILIALMADNME